MAAERPSHYLSLTSFGMHMMLAIIQWQKLSDRIHQEKSAEELVPLAKSWEYPPDVKTSDVTEVELDQAKRAFVLNGNNTGH